MRDRFFQGAVFSAAIALGSGLGAQAQDVEAGHRLASRWCTSCHNVEKRIQGPLKDAVPSFVSIAKMPTTTQRSLTVFLVTPHAAMPNYTLSWQEISDVSAYILSLREDESGPTHAATRPPSR